MKFDVPQKGQFIWKSLEMGCQFLGSSFKTTKMEAKEESKNMCWTNWTNIRLKKVGSIQTIVVNYIHVGFTPPTPSNSQHQYYYIFRIGDPNLNFQF